MRRLFEVTLVLAVCLAAVGASAQDYVLHDDSIPVKTYFCYYSATTWRAGGIGNVEIYDMNVSAGSSASKGWMLYQPAWGSYYLVTMHSYDFNGWCITGRWTGSPSTCYRAGQTYAREGTLYYGPAKAAAAGGSEDVAE
jgi:hypothetical protein